ncbi:6-bladed beta-propeller protein [Belliella buryatensis]|uniref:6-bladed beta-propeller protein n=1 Tax=Belliella buryatensis TaxID=1500549 RepID=A0A239AH97_9BACT|nr:6-bladed beta-propeller [Belliella buryatensis]SNR95015.1 6-bladed beta-propeller protein [Belliella buryatensis]
MYRHVFVLFLSFSFLCGCNGKLQDFDVQKIDINLSESEVNSISDIAQNVNYILLDTPEEIPLVKPYKIVFHKNKIYVEDRVLSNLLIFDRSGKLVKSIMSTGKGPSEFYLLEDFCINNNKLFIKDKILGKILTYDLDGNFIEEIRQYVDGPNFFRGENFILEYMDNKISWQNFNFLRIENSKIQGFVDIKKGFEKLRYSDNNGFIKNQKNNQVIFNIPFSYSIAFFDSSGILKNQIEFDLGKNSIDDLKRIDFNLNHNKRLPYVSENEIVENIGLFAPYKDSFLVTFQQGYKDNHLLILNDSLSIIYQAKNFINDLDGFTLKYYPWTFSEFGFVCLFSSSQLYNSYIETFQGRSLTPLPDDIHGFFQENKEKLKGDYHVLVEFELK